MDDVLLVTIDCWRRDAPDFMPDFQEATQDWEYRDLLTTAAATNGVFPAILASSYEFAVYREDGQVAEHVEPLPKVLENAGYDTAGFVASNPFLAKWSPYFETFWNDGMHADGVNEHRWDDGRFDKVTRFLRFEPKVSDATVLRRARDWWDEQSSPRFLWVHLMGPHAPYYPGFQRARSIGLFRSYLAIVGYSQRREEVPAWLHGHIRRLYEQCLEQLDETLTPFLQTLSDEASILVMADHGEEFDHGIFGHARLYNETTRCPYVTNDSRLVPNANAVRQLDVGPTLCAALGLDIPASWEGTEATYEETPLQPMLTDSESRDQLWAGVHDETRKLIRTSDRDGEQYSMERYHLLQDPDEQSPVDELPDDDSVTSALEAFLCREDLVDGSVVAETGIGDDVEDRLSELGYL